jgi:hypothetical protein
LGERIQGIAAQQAVSRAIAVMLAHVEFREIFTPLDRAVVREDFRRLAQTVNHNERRRRKRSGTIRPKSRPPIATPADSGLAGSETARSQSSESPSPDVDRLSMDPLSQPVPPSFGFTIIMVQRLRGETRTCRPTNFCNGTIGARVVDVDDMMFEKFLSFLRNDMKYHEEDDVLIYLGPNGRKIPIPDERAWRTALFDMHSQGKRNLKFTVEQRIRK